MLDIKFFACGQGDTILVKIKRQNDDDYNVLIDCHSGIGNRVIEYVEYSSISRIDLIVITHHHLDHISGLKEFLEYCKMNSIATPRILHTSQDVRERWRSTMGLTTSYKEKTTFLELWEYIQKLKTEGTVQTAIVPSEPDFGKSLSDEIELSFMAPSEAQYDAYKKSVLSQVLSSAGSDPSANLLATSIRLKSKEGWTVLLNSDSSNKALWKRKKDGYLKGDKFILVQISHHGSKYEFSEALWNYISANRFNGIIKIALSCDNNYPSTPSNQVITYFDSKKLEYSATVGDIGMMNKPRLSADERNRLNILKTHSIKSNSSRKKKTYQDLYYHIEKRNICETIVPFSII